MEKPRCKWLQNVYLKESCSICKPTGQKYIPEPNRSRRDLEIHVSPAKVDWLTTKSGQKPQKGLIRFFDSLWNEPRVCVKIEIFLDFSFPLNFPTNPAQNGNFDHQSVADFSRGRASRHSSSPAFTNFCCPRGQVSQHAWPATKSQLRAKRGLGF